MSWSASTGKNLVSVCIIYPEKRRRQPKCLLPVLFNSGLFQTAAAIHHPFISAFFILKMFGFVASAFLQLHIRWRAVSHYGHGVLKFRYANNNMKQSSLCLLSVVLRGGGRFACDAAARWGKTRWRQQCQPLPIEAQRARRKGKHWSPLERNRIIHPSCCTRHLLHSAKW